MKKTFILIALLPAVTFFAGCGTGDYEKRIASSLSQGSGSGPKILPDTATTIPGTPFSVRLPSALQSVDMGDAVRGKFPVFEIGGLKAVYEGSVEDASKNKQCFYLYIGVTTKLENNQLPTQSWLNDLSTKNVSDASTALNKSYTASSPEGSSVQYEEIHFKCMQKFFYPKPDNPNNTMDIMGNVVCLSHVENDQVVSLVFRYPDTLKDVHGPNFDPEWIKMIAGTLKSGG